VELLGWFHIITRSHVSIRIAQDIVVEELQEIAAMRAALGEKLTPAEATLAAGNRCRRPSRRPLIRRPSR
jgi:hypothetical protein